MSVSNDPRLNQFHNYGFNNYCADQAEITRLRAELAKVTGERDALREALKTCSDDLADELQARYDGLLTYPCMQDDYDRDMASVLDARTLLATPQPPAPAYTVRENGMVDADTNTLALEWAKGKPPAPGPASEGPKCCGYCHGFGPHPMSAYDECPRCGTGRAQ